ncbi:MAG: hypothetical protein HOM11_11360 [Methylococcales bacterium]|jgi:hypothetical protein|nr:hypothetical protein [Methylococcales bacterium]MBT7442703.1 hypothetical protein [Methylococcales bacterium]
MQKVSLFFCFGLFFLAIAIIAPKPTPQRPAPYFIENPIFLRMLLGPFHTLAADSYWLRSVNIDPQDQPKNRDKQSSDLFDGAKLIQTLDPLFELNLRYSATYLASIRKDVDAAHALCDIAIRFHPQYSYPYILKISNELGYRHPYRYDKIIEWVKLAKNTTIDSPAWLTDVLVMARNKNDQSELVLADLNWLLGMAKSPQEAQMIQAKIDKIKHAQAL